MENLPLDCSQRKSLPVDYSLPGDFASGLLATRRVCLWTALYQTACLQIANGYPDCSLPELLTVHPAPTYFFMVYHRNERNVNIFSWLEDVLFSS